MLGRGYLLGNSNCVEAAVVVAGAPGAGGTPKVGLDRRVIPAFSSARNSSSVTQCLSGSSCCRRAKTGTALPVSMCWTTPWRGLVAAWLAAAVSEIP